MSLSAADVTGSDVASWRGRARCAETELELFFSSDEDAQARALELCRSCPVREPCYRFAVEQGEMHGIWGGTEASERRSNIRERRRRQRDQSEAA